MKQYVIAIRVKNSFGVLARVAAMFSRRGFNIDSLAVGETETPGVSRITVAMKGDEYIRNQMIKQLSKLQEVLEISEMAADECVNRELLMIKVKLDSADRRELMDAVNIFRANIIDYAVDSMCIVITGETSKLNAFIELMKPFGILEMCRTGVVALERGSNCLKNKNMNYIYQMNKITKEKF